MRSTRRIAKTPPSGSISTIWTKVAALLKPGDWNKFKIGLHGKKITVWFNGEKVLEHEQEKFTEASPIGLQCQKEAPGMKVEYRNLRVREI